MAAVLNVPPQFLVAGPPASQARSPPILSCRARDRFCLQSGSKRCLGSQGSGRASRSVAFFPTQSSRVRLASLMDFPFVHAKTIHSRCVGSKLIPALVLLSPRLSHSPPGRRSDHEFQHLPRLTAV